MRTPFSILSIFALSAVVHHASADDDARTISPVGCVAPSAFQDCLNQATMIETTCIDDATDAEVVVACGTIFLINEMQCYYESCWNKVYSCEYQYLVNQYQTERDLVTPETIPFWPAPDNAPGGCSCNLGDFYVNATGNIVGSIGCFDKVNNVLDITGQEQCDCCAFSAAIGAYYAICPDFDPTQVDFDDVLVGITNYEAETGLICSDVIANTSCLADWGFGSAYNGIYLDPAVSLPPNGTQPLSTTTAAGSLTSPPGGATMTWSLLGAVRTATAAEYNEESVKATTAPVSSSEASATGSLATATSMEHSGTNGVATGAVSITATAGTTVPTGTGSAAGATSTTAKTGGAEKMVADIRVLALVGLMVVV